MSAEAMAPKGNTVLLAKHAAYASIATFGVIVLMAAPWKTASPVGLALATIWSLLVAVLLFICLRLKQPLMAVMVTLYATAYSSELGDSVVEGVSRNGVLAPPESVIYAAFQFVVFLWFVILSAMLLARVLSRRQTDTVEESNPYSQTIAHLLLWLLFGGALLAALSTGFSTYYGAERSDNVGGFRLELHYVHILWAVFALQVDLFPWASAKVSHRWLRLVVFAGLAVLLFALQLRRMMAACAALAVFSAVVAEHRRADMGKGRRRFLLATLVVASVLGTAIVGSSVWRRELSASGSMVGQLGSTVSRFMEGPRFEREHVQTRFTYLWVDGVSIEYGKKLRPLSLYDEFKYRVITYTPAIIYPDKYTVPYESCETALRPLGLREDLPCTATSEGYLAFGLGGVVFVALLWGLCLGIVSMLTKHPSTALRIFAYFLFVIWLDVETGAFPMFAGLRIALICGAPVVVLAYLIAPGLKSLSKTPPPGALQHRPPLERGP